MSVTLTTRIGCDLPEGCTATYEAASWPGDARAAAARAGWSSNPDRCPAHPPGVPAAGAPTLFDYLPEAAAPPPAGRPRVLTDTEVRRLNAGRLSDADPVVALGMAAPNPPLPGEGRLQYLARTAAAGTDPNLRRRTEGPAPHWRLEQATIGPGYTGEALLDAAGAYRYALTRRWAPGRCCAWVMLNPSTADASTDDATIRRCVGYAKRWRYGSILVLNLFAARATDPRVMRAFKDPTGPDNNRVIVSALTQLPPVDEGISESVGRVVLAWGTNGSHLGRDAVVARLIRGVWGVPLCLALTAGGHPAHPLRLAGDLVAFEYPGIAG